MDDKKFTITISGEGYEIDDKINKAQLSRILPIVASGSELPAFEQLSNPSVKINSVKRRTKPNNFTPLLVRLQLERLSIDPVSSQYGNYWTIKTKADRLMWILAVLNEKKIESVNQKELTFIGDKLGDNIPKKSITSLLDSHKKGGRIAPSLIGTVRTVRILKPGLDFVKNLQIVDSQST